MSLFRSTTCMNGPISPFKYIIRHKKSRSAKLMNIPSELLPKPSQESQNSISNIISTTSTRDAVLSVIEKHSEELPPELHEVTSQFSNKFLHTPAITDSTGLIVQSEIQPYHLTLSAKAFNNFINLNKNLKNKFMKEITNFPVDHLKIFVLDDPKITEQKEFDIPDFVDPNTQNYFLFEELRAAGHFSKIDNLRKRIDDITQDAGFLPQQPNLDLYLEFINKVCSEYYFYSDIQVIGTSLLILGMSQSLIGFILKSVFPNGKIDISNPSNLDSLLFHSLRGDKYDDGGKNQNFASLSQADSILLSQQIENLLLQNKYVLKQKITNQAQNLLAARKMYVQRVFNILSLDMDAARFSAVKHYLSNSQSVENSVNDVFLRMGLDAKKAQNIERIRYYNCTKTAIVRWFCQFFVYIYKVIGPNYNCLWNIDEMSIAFDTKSIWVYSRAQGQLLVPLSEDVAHITVLCGFNAAGDKLPPMVILNNVKKLSSSLCNIVQRRAYIASSQNGWITKPLFKEYIDLILQHFSSCCSSAKRHCITSDGHPSRLNYPAALNCAIHHTDLLTLGSHSTHCEQPFDVVAARPFKEGYKTLYLNQREKFPEIDTETQRCLIIRCILDSYETKLTPDICRKSFEVSGLAPLSLNNMIKPDLINLMQDEDKERTLRMRSNRAVASSSLLTSNSMLEYLKQKNIESNERKRDKTEANPNEVKRKESIIFRCQDDALQPHTLSNNILVGVEELEQQYELLPEEEKFVSEIAEGIFQNKTQDESVPSKFQKATRSKQKGNSKLWKRFDKIQNASFDPIEIRKKPN